MIGNAKKVFIALSGGVDSSTTAAILQQNGFDCAGVFMITCDAGFDKQSEVKEAADQLGIKLYVLDLRKDFEQIFDYFCGEYKKGRTPNPCIVCNKLIKFGKLWDFARSNGAELFATGHYARIIRHNTEFGLYEATDEAKDQSYALVMIDKNILPHIILPMGDYSKDQTRRMAAKFGLGTKDKQESQEICFIPDGDWVSALERRCPGLVRKGNIVDSSGKVLGEHNGVHRFTIGQRRGLHIAMGKPHYVVKIDAESNTVTLGPKEEVMHRRLRATGMNWLVDRPKTSFCAKVKIRYNDKGNPATVIPQGDSVMVEFDEPVSAITPGQLTCLLVQEGENSRIVGGGWIEKSGD